MTHTSLRLELTTHTHPETGHNDPQICLLLPNLTCPMMKQSQLDDHHELNLLRTLMMKSNIRLMINLDPMTEGMVLLIDS